MKKVYAFHRVEPISREGDPGRGLAAPVHDPLWGLARQRQFGELAGEDTGSPVQVALRMRVDPIDGWRPTGDGDVLPYDPDAEVLEAVVAGEPAGPGDHRCATGSTPDVGWRRSVPAGLLGRPPRRGARCAVTADRRPRLVRRAAATYPDGIAVAARVRAARRTTTATWPTALGYDDRARHAAPRGVWRRTPPGARPPSGPDPPPGSPSGWSAASSWLRGTGSC